MRIGLALERFDPRRGGLEVWTTRFASFLAARGHEVHIIAGGGAREAENLPIHFHRAEGDSRLLLAAGIEHRARSLALDIVHDMGVGWYCDLFHPHGGCWLSLRQQRLREWPTPMRPLKRFVDGFSPRLHELRQLVDRQYVDRGQTFLALSQFVARDLQHFHRVPQERIRLVYNGVDTERFSPTRRKEHRSRIRRQLGISDDATVALAIGHNFGLKGVPLLLRAMQRLAHQNTDVNLLVVGGKRLARWKHCAYRLSIADRVHFVGTVPDTVPYYAASDFLVHATRYDPCSLVLLEAMSSGLPIVTTNEYNGVAELMTQGREGLFITDPASIEQTTDAIRILVNRSTRERLGAAARRLAERHTFERNGYEIIRVYEEILARRDPAVGAPVQTPTAPDPRSHSFPLGRKFLEKGNVA
jgi:UDP-glucose:(heptosyl)LPS alpha-1,3-glucosyltransferase